MKPWAFILWASLAWHGSSKSDAADCEAQVTALHAKMRAVTDCYSVLGGLTGKEADDTDFTQVCTSHCVTVIKNWVDDFALLVEECQQTAEDSEGLEQLDLALSTFDGVCMKYQDKFCGERETAISAIQLALEACSVESEEKEKDEHGVETRTRDIFLDVCTVDCKTALTKLDDELGCCFGGLLDLATQTMPQGESLRQLVEGTCEIKTCDKFVLPAPLLQESDDWERRVEAANVQEGEVGSESTTAQPPAAEEADPFYGGLQPEGANAAEDEAHERVVSEHFEDGEPPYAGTAAEERYLPDLVYRDEETEGEQGHAGVYRDEFEAEDAEKNGDYYPDHDEFQNSFTFDEGGTRGIPTSLVVFLSIGTVLVLTLLFLWSKGSTRFSLLRRFQYETISSKDDALADARL